MVAACLSVHEEWNVVQPPKPDFKSLQKIILKIIKIVSDPNFSPLFRRNFFESYNILIFVFK